MSDRGRQTAGDTLQVLAEFRHQLRLFLQFSEMAAKRSGLEPQQHQLLLQIAGAPEGVRPTIGYAAERLGLRHNSVVELCNRSAEAGLIVRRQVGSDRRCVELRLTALGLRLLGALSVDHARELNEAAPRMIGVLSRLGAVHFGEANRADTNLTNPDRRAAESSTKARRSKGSEV